MSQGPLCPNLSQKVQKEVFQMANRNLSCVILLGGLSVNLNHLKMTQSKSQIKGSKGSVGGYPPHIYHHIFWQYVGQHAGPVDPGQKNDPK